MADAEITLPPVHAMQAECRVQIHDDLKLRLSLQEWENNFKRALVRIENKRTRSLSVKNELYQLISFYSVFQGVVLTAVAQASTLKCHTAWGPASLSAIASIATLFGVHNKLIDYYVLKSELKKEEDDANVSLACAFIKISVLLELEHFL